MKLSECTKGRHVVYRSRPGAVPEDGTVVRISGSLVMVRYWQDGKVKATYPRDLEPAALSSLT